MKSRQREVCVGEGVREEHHPIQHLSYSNSFPISFLPVTAHGQKVLPAWAGLCVPCSIFTKQRLGPASPALCREGKCHARQPTVPILYLCFRQHDILDDGLPAGLVVFQLHVGHLVAPDLPVLLVGDGQLPAHPDGCRIHGLHLHLSWWGTGHCNTHGTGT